MFESIFDISRTFLSANPLGIISFFLLGVLIIVILQNSFNYKLYKNKAYLWYVIYASIIFLDQVLIHYIRYIQLTDPNILERLSLFYPIHQSLEWLYNSTYVIFVIEFGGVHLRKYKAIKRIKSFVFLSVGLMMILYILDVIFHNNYVRYAFIYFQVPSLIIISLIVYYYLFKMKTAFKYYIILGSLAFSIFSILALLSTLIDSVNNQYGWLFFYSGVFIEVIFFTFGLMVKQKLILRENEELKNALTTKLQEEVSIKTAEIISLNKRAEGEKIKKLEIAFEKEIAELKISSLQSQMNPHFIFNSLNSIKIYIIKNDHEKAVHYLNNFSKLIRKILAGSRKKEVTLQEELDTVSLYAKIENMRFKNTIDFSMDIDSTLNLIGIKIPPLILQPFIENAIWHGLSSKKENKKLVVTVTKQNEDYTQISIFDNGIGREKSKAIKEKKFYQKESIGLKLTEERLDIFSKNLSNKYQLYFNDLKSGTEILGTEVVIMLPMK